MTLDPSDNRPSGTSLPGQPEMTPLADSDPNLNAVNIPGVERSIASLEQTLSRLQPWQGNVYVHHNLRAGDGTEECLMTFRREGNGNFTVWNGKPSLNGTLIVSADGEFSPVQAPVLLKEGDAFYLGSDKTARTNPHPFNLVRVPVDAGSLAPDPLEQSIQKLAEGESLMIGRQIQKERVLHGDGGQREGEFGRSVSRLHCTLTRQEDAIHPDGRRQKIYQLVDGVPGTQKLFAETAGGEIREFTREIELPTGASIRIGSPTGPAIEIPDPLRGFDASVAIRGKSLLESIAAHAQSMGAGDISMQSISFRRQEDLLGDQLNVERPQAQLLGSHLSEGLQLIRSGSYERAIKHFSQEEVLEACGFTVTGPSYFSKGVTTISGEEVYSLLQEIASRPWFHSGSQEVSPSYGALQKATGELTPTEQAHLQEFNRELSLLYAEEWTHAFQAAMGILVSQKGELIKHLPDRSLSHPREYDVAELFSEQRIPLSEMFLERYNRDDVHAILKSYSTRAECTKIRCALAVADAGAQVIIGRDPMRANKFPRESAVDIHCVRFTVETDDLPMTQAEVRSDYMAQQIAPAHISVSPNGDGTYSVEPLSEKSQHKVFVKDAHNIWRTVEQRENLPSGSAIRLGTSFEFRLP